MDPQYGKYPANPATDHKQMTWEKFLTIREWAQKVANEQGYPVYLVGSVLRREYPRDLDISMIMPVVDYESRFGKIDTHDTSTPKEAKEIIIPYVVNLNERLRHYTRIDFKITPDCWFVDRDKLLLAAPNGKVIIRSWDMVFKYQPTEQ